MEDSEQEQPSSAEGVEQPEAPDSLRPAADRLRLLRQLQKSQQSKGAALCPVLSSHMDSPRTQPVAAQVCCTSAGYLRTWCVWHLQPMLTRLQACS